MANKRKKRKAARARRFHRFLMSLLMTALIACALLRVFVFEMYYVTTSAMDPVYRKGDLVVTFKHDVDMNQVQRGDILLSLFGGNGEKYIRRVSGVAGDLIDVRENGKFLVYADAQGVMREKALGDAPALVHGEIPEGAYLMLSDNLSENTPDGRTFGLIYETDISARPGKILWPLSRRG